MTRARFTYSRSLILSTSEFSVSIEAAVGVCNLPEQLDDPFFLFLVQVLVQPASEMLDGNQVFRDVTGFLDQLGGLFGRQVEMRLHQLEGTLASSSSSNT